MKAELCSIYYYQYTMNWNKLYFFKYAYEYIWLLRESADSAECTYFESCSEVD